MYKAIFATLLVISVNSNALIYHKDQPIRSFTLTLTPAVGSIANPNGIPITLHLTNPNSGYVPYGTAGSLTEALRFRVRDEHGTEVQPRPYALNYRGLSPNNGIAGNITKSITVDILAFVPITRPGTYTVSAELKLGYVGEFRSGEHLLKAPPVTLTVTP